MLNLAFFLFATVGLTLEQVPLQVDGKEALIYRLTQKDGSFGVRFKKGEPFSVELTNALPVPSSIHWHGLLLPNNQDGVANITQFPLYPGVSYHYEFPLLQTGTYWMHAHFSLQEQRLLSAPLIIEEESPYEDKVLFLTDFSFRSPEEIYEELRCGKKMQDMRLGQDLTDVNYDAFLANFATLNDPVIYEVNPGQQLRLRVINGASATNFFLNLEPLEGRAIAIDGNEIGPVKAKLFELAVAQRIDILLSIPEEGGVFPILAVAEGTDRQTGIILKTKGTDFAPFFQTRATKMGALKNSFEALFHPVHPLEKKEIERKLRVELGGDMSHYSWTLNEEAWPNITPLEVVEGERCELTFHNKTAMSHPMHLHGHVFQVTALDGQTVNGPMRDTVLVLPGSQVSVQFDALHPGVWPLHCHILYHQEAGMMTVLRYKGFVQNL